MEGQEGHGGRGSMGSSSSCVELGSGKIDREARRQGSDQAEWCYGGNSFELNFKF